MDPQFGVVYPLWNHAASQGRLLDRLTGEVGIDHLTIPVVTGARRQFRLGCGRDTPYFHTEGGWHFRPSAGAYSSSALRPPKARWLAGGDVLAQVREQTAALGMQLLLRLEVRAVEALVEQQRHLCQRNAWGQEVPSAGACVCNPDLRELLRGTLEDLCRYEPAGYELVDWAPDSAADRSAARPLAWHTAARHLLDTCFCASCRQIAEREGVDTDQVARSVRVHVERLAAAGIEEPSAADRDPALAAYIAARTSDCRQWLQRLVAPETDRLHLLVHSVGEPPPYGDRPPWPRLVRLPVTAREPADQDRLAALLQVAPYAGGLALPVWRPTFGQAAELVRVLSETVRLGVRLFDCEGLDEAEPEAVKWLKQAVRFARRG